MNHLNFFRLSITLTLLLFFCTLKGQNTNTTNLYSISEKIDLYTDRDTYFSGEEILFIADYLVNNKKSTTQISNILYVEIINCSNSESIIQEKIRITDYNAYGKLSIPDNIATGMYMLRAYTQYQRNFSPINYAHHFVRILNPENTPLQIINAPIADSIRIVPEGNTLLDNVKNKVVIQLPTGLSNSNFKYFISEGKSKIVKAINPNMFGIDEVELTFSSLKQYKLLIVNSKGDSIFKNFPAVFQSGIQANTEQFEDNITYSIRSKNLNVEKRNQSYQVKVLSNDHTLKFRKEISLVDSIVKINIGLNDLEYGINYIVLSDSNDKIEKINSIYKPIPKLDGISVETEKNKYSSREDVTVNFSTSTKILEDLKNVSISVSLYDPKSFENGYFTTHYLTHPLLLEDYLSKSTFENKKSQSQIMVLFDKTLNNETFNSNGSKISTFEYYPEVRDLSLKGLLVNKKTKEPLANQDVCVTVLSGNPQIHFNKTNSNGEFIFSLNNLFKENDIYVCAPKLAGNDHEILIKNSFANSIPKFNDLPVFIDTSEKYLISKIYQNAQINTRFNKKQPTTTTNNQDNYFNLDGAKVTTTLDEYIRLENMEELFKEVVQKIIVRKIKGQYTFTVVNESGNPLSDDPLILLDKIPISNPNQIMQLDISQIKKIDVLYKTYILGANTINGIIMITTNTDNYAGTKFPESSKFIKYKCLEKQEDFSTYYISSVPDKYPDFRSTLYWNPNMKLQGNNQSFNFKTSDSKGIYSIIVKGYTSKGELYVGKKQITVE